METVEVDQERFDGWRKMTSKTTRFLREKTACCSQGDNVQPSVAGNDCSFSTRSDPDHIRLPCGFPKWIVADRKGAPRPEGKKILKIFLAFTPISRQLSVSCGFKGPFRSPRRGGGTT